MTTSQLCYFGGSGGFFVLWHILLGTNYNCILQDTDQAYYDIKGQLWPTINELPAIISDLPDSIQEELTNNQEWKLIVEQTIENKNSSRRSINSKFYKPQWNVNEDRSKWKETEKWPTNLLTQKSSFENKLFFHCEPSAADMMPDCNKKILLYTDIETQSILAKNKNAWIFRNGHCAVTQTAKFNGFEVYHEVAKFAEYTDYQIRLQDIVNTQGQAVLDIFGLTINENNIYHNNMWLNLHTNIEKEYIVNGRRTQ